MGRPLPSQTACNLEFRPPLVRPIRRRAALFQQTGGRSMSLEMCAVDHDAIRFAGVSGERGKDAIKYAQSAPAHETVVQSLGWPIPSRCIAPAQTVADDKDDPTDHAAIIDAGNAM